MMSFRVWIIVLVVIAAAVGAWVFTRKDAVIGTVALPTSSTTLPCEADARCVGSPHVAAVATACRPGIENLARYRVRWSDAAGPSFTRFAWRDRAQGTITFSGDRAEFENASGSFQTVTYECDFDPAQGKLLDTRVLQGALH